MKNMNVFVCILCRFVLWWRSNPCKKVLIEKYMYKLDFKLNYFTDYL